MFCTSQFTDLQRSYTTTFAQTANLTTFMQKDTINVDLGYVVNGGFTYKMKNWTDTDDTFVIRVQVQLADLNNTGNGTEHFVYMSVKFGDVYVVGERRMCCTHFELHSLHIRLRTLQPSRKWLPSVRPTGLLRLETSSSS